MPGPPRVAAVVLLASIGPGCVNGWDRLLAAPGAGQLCALVAWRLTPWMARARLARIRRRRGRPLRPDEHVNWQVWGRAGREYRPLWRTFLTEQRALLRELGELESAIPSVQAPVLLLADPEDTQVPVGTARRLVQTLPDARLQLVQGAGHHLPRCAQMWSPMRSWRSWPRWKNATAQDEALFPTSPGWRLEQLSGPIRVSTTGRQIG